VISLAAPRVDPGKKWDASKHTAHSARKQFPVTTNSAVQETKKMEHYFPKKHRMNLPDAPRSDQLLGEVLWVKWLAELLCPFNLVDDAGFCQYSSNLSKKFSVPGRQKMRNQLVKFAELVQKKMKDKIKEEVTYFSATTDTWSSQNMERFMAITLHALSKEFEMINLTSAVEPLREKHTANAIQQKLMQVGSRPQKHDNHG
jgi:hypothetical protein